MKVGKERERSNQSFNGGWLSKWERKLKEWIKHWKEDEYENGKGTGKNELNMEKRTNINVGMISERIN